MSEIFASPWIPTIATLLLACGARLLSKSWLAPGPFALLIWGTYLVLPLIVAPWYKVSALGVWLILGLVLCTAIGADLGVGKVTVHQSNVRLDAGHAKAMLYWVLFLSLPGLLGGLYWAEKTLNANALDFSVPGLLALGHILSVERYAGGQPPLIARTLVIWVYPAVLLAGMTAAIVRSRRDRILCSFSLIPSILLSALQAARANTLISVVLGLSGYLAMKAFLGGSPQRLLSRRAMIVMATSVIAGVSFFLAVDTLRSHDQEDQEIQVDADWGRVRSAMVGYLAVFGHWASSPEGPGTFRPKWGAYTFGGPLEAVGLHTRLTGVFAVPVSLEDGESNIHTAFRGLIEDFTLPGAAVCCFVVGVLSGWAYRNALLGRESWTLALAAFYAFFFWSPIISIFNYNGPILALLVCMLALKKVRASVGPASAPDALSVPGLRAARW